MNKRGKRWVINVAGLQTSNKLTRLPFYKINDVDNVEVNYTRCINKLRTTIGKCFKENVCTQDGNLYKISIVKLIKRLEKLRKGGKSQRHNMANLYIAKIKE